MVTAQAESYSACLDELKAIYPQHWTELAVDPSIPLAPRYDVYASLNAMGQVLLVTLRDGKKLAGYFLGFVMPALHYQTSLTCTGDFFYVLPEYRDGRAGTKLFREVERVLRVRGVQRWLAASKIHKDSGALLRRMGFTAIEVGYSKRLD